ncbi:MAG: hypothetical protein PHQ43_01085 [Dehalococcoidales bacterium]|nr:hypothetical protein [Dehalococcoidales bacterium]
MKTELKNILNDAVQAIESSADALNACVERIDKLYQDERRVTHVVRSEHEAGERFMGEVCSFDTIKIKPGEHLEYAGEMSEIGADKSPQWTDTDGTAVYAWSETPCEILRVVPDEPAPKFKVGDWVWHDSAGLNIIDNYDRETNHYFLRSHNWCPAAMLRPAKKSDYVFTVDGKQMIVCENGEGSLYISMANKRAAIYPNLATGTFILACIREHGIIPCPVEVHKGDMTLPKEE